MATYAQTDPDPPFIGYFDHQDVFDITFDFSLELAGDADTLTGTPVVEVPEGMGLGDGTTTVTTPAGNRTPDAPSIIDSSTKVKVWLYGASPGVEYRVRCSVLTANGRSWNRSVRFGTRRR